VFSAHVLVAYSDHSIARSSQKLGTCAVIGLLSSSVVRVSLQLDDDAFSRAVKVNDEPVKHVLPPELQAEDASVTQQRPCMTLGGSTPIAQRAGERESLRRPEATERIHRARMPMQLRVEVTRIPRMCRKHCPANSPFVPPLPKGEGDRG